MNLVAILMEREILINNFMVNTGQLCMCLHVCEDACSNVLIISLVASNYLWYYCPQMYSQILAIPFFKTRFWKPHLKQQTEHLFLFFFSINVK